MPMELQLNSSKGVETDGKRPGYKYLCIPRRMVGESQITSKIVSSGTQVPGQDVPGYGLAGSLRKVRIWSFKLSS